MKCTRPGKGDRNGAKLNAFKMLKIFPPYILNNDFENAEDLAGWDLTDDPADLRKWQFSSTLGTSPLADDGYLTVFVDDSPDAVVGN